MNRRTLCLLATLLIAVGGRGSAEAADGLREAKAHAERGLRQYNLGNFEDAIAEFSKAYEIDPSPVLLYNIAHAHRAAGNLDRALFFYRRYLAESEPDASNREKAKQLIHELEEKIAGEKASKENPSPVVPASPAPVVAAATPSPAPDPSLTPSVPPVPPPKLTAAPSPSRVDVAPPSPESHTTKRTLAWIAGGAAIVSIGTGAVFQISAGGNLSDFNNSCGLVPGTNKPIADPNKPGRTTSDCANLYDSWKSENRWALAGYLAGAAFAVTSTVLFVTSRPESPASGVRAHVECRPGPGTVLCGGVF
jgi:tetratricopeptide (TPR) repeat protein